MVVVVSVTTFRVCMPMLYLNLYQDVKPLLKPLQNKIASSAIQPAGQICRFEERFSVQLIEAYKARVLHT